MNDGIYSMTRKDVRTRLRDVPAREFHLVGEPCAWGPDISGENVAHADGLLKSGDEHTSYVS